MTVKIAEKRLPSSLQHNASQLKNSEKDGIRGKGRILVPVMIHFERPRKMRYL